MVFTPRWVSFRPTQCSFLKVTYLCFLSINNFGLYWLYVPAGAGVNGKADYRRKKTDWWRRFFYFGLSWWLRPLWETFNLTTLCYYLKGNFASGRLVLRFRDCIISSLALDWFSPTGLRTCMNNFKSWPDVRVVSLSGAQAGVGNFQSNTLKKPVWQASVRVSAGCLASLKGENGWLTC